MAVKNSNHPWFSRGAFMFIVWIAVAYACIMAFKYLDTVMAFFASLTTVMLAWLIDDMTSVNHDEP